MLSINYDTKLNIISSHSYSYNGQTNSKRNSKTEGTNSDTGSNRKRRRFADGNKPVCKDTERCKGERCYVSSSKELLQHDRTCKETSGKGRSAVERYPPFLFQCFNCGSIALVFYDNRFRCNTCGVDDYAD